MRILSGHICDRSLILEDDETETTGSIGVSVVDDFDGLDGAEGSEIIFQHGLICIARAADENFAVVFVPHCVDGGRKICLLK